MSKYRNNEKKYFFSKKGNPDDYNYLEHQIVFIVIAAIFVGLIVLGSELGLF